jgi:hypothetical protein
MLAQRYGGYPWAIGSEPAEAVYRHLWLMSFSQETEDFRRDGPSEDEAMRLMILSRAEAAGS